MASRPVAIIRIQLVTAIPLYPFAGLATGLGETGAGAGDAGGRAGGAAPGDHLLDECLAGGEPLDAAAQLRGRKERHL